MEPREILCEGYDISRSGAIIGKHVARQGMPILSAQRDEPIRDVDTGWHSPAAFTTTHLTMVSFGALRALSILITLFFK